ncbi:MAG: DUF4340 domain-containing protein [Pseudomonadales bacterium]
MNGRTGLLSILLLAQLLAVAGLWFANNNSEPVAQSLLVFEPSEITRLDISERLENGANSASLIRQEQGWELEGYTVDGEKITTLLAQLSSLDSPWPVATTTAAQKRFEVTDDGYQKRVDLFNGEIELGTLFIGTSPGFKRIHARRKGDDDIYSIALTSLELPAQVNDWLDKRLLAASQEVSGIARAGHWEAALQEAGDDQAGSLSWSLRPLGDVSAEVPIADSEAIANLIGRFKSLQVTGVVPSNPNAASTTEPPPVDSFELQIDVDQALSYQLYHDEQADQYSMSRAGLAGRYEIPAYIAEQMQLSVADLSQSKTPEEGGAAAEAQPVAEPASASAPGA